MASLGTGVLAAAMPTQYAVSAVTPYSGGTIGTAVLRELEDGDVIINMPGPYAPPIKGQLWPRGKWE